MSSRPELAFSIISLSKFNVVLIDIYAFFVFICQCQRPPFTGSILTEKFNHTAIQIMTQTHGIFWRPPHAFLPDIIGFHAKVKTQVLMPLLQVFPHKSIKFRSNGPEIPHLSIHSRNELTVKYASARVPFPDDRFQCRHKPERSQADPYNPPWVNVSVHQFQGL